MASNLLLNRKNHNNMAIRDLTNTSVEKKWTSAIRLPKDRYTCRCINESFGVSNGGNNMVTEEWEVATPNDILVGNDKVIVAGVVKFKLYFPVVVKEDGVINQEKSDKAVARYKEHCTKLGLDIDWSAFDDENPPLKKKGMLADMILQCEEGVQRKEPKPGQKMGDPIKDASGNDVIRYEAKLAFDGVLGPASMPANQPY